jgi:hypothetical protein
MRLELAVLKVDAGCMHPTIKHSRLKEEQWRERRRRTLMWGYPDSSANRWRETTLIGCSSYDFSKELRRSGRLFHIGYVRSGRLLGSRL